MRYVLSSLEMGMRIGTGRSVRIHRLSYKQFTRKSRSCTCNQNKATNSFVTSHWQAGVQPLPGKQDSSHVIVSWEVKHHNSECPTLPLFHYIQFYGRALYHVIQNIPSVTLSQLSQPCSLLTCVPAGKQLDKQKSSWLCENTSEQALKHYFHHKSKRHHGTRHKEEN